MLIPDISVSGIETVKVVHMTGISDFLVLNSDQSLLWVIKMFWVADLTVHYLDHN